MTDLEKTLKLISDASDRLTQSYDYQRGVLNERARCAALADSIADTYAGDECGCVIAAAIRGQKETDQ